MDSQDPVGPPPVLYKMMGVWSTLTGILGFLANLLAVCLFIKVRKLRTPFNCLLINLSATELVISMFGNSLLAYNSFHKGETGSAAGES